MGIADIRNAFNEVVRPQYSCGKAMMALVRDDGTEWQVITFHGTSSQGDPFEIASSRHSPNDNPEVIARETATAFLLEPPKG